jgi:hypothetical protein
MTDTVVSTVLMLYLHFIEEINSVPHLLDNKGGGRCHRMIKNKLDGIFFIFFLPNKPGNDLK